MICDPPRPLTSEPERSSNVSCQRMDFSTVPSVAAVRRHFDVLADSIASIGPDRIYQRLCSRGLLSSDVLQHTAVPDTQYSRALGILNVIEEALIADPLAIRKFLKVLKKEKPLQQVTANILSSYSKSRTHVSNQK